MKILDIVEQSNVTPDMRHGAALSPRQLELVYKKIMSEKQPLTKEEIKDMAREMEVDGVYGRTSASAEFALTRMHILIHDMAPYGETEKRAETMFTIPNIMMEFVKAKGIDPNEAIATARKELSTRRRKIKRPEAVKIMSEFYMKNKDRISPEVKQHRDAIVTSIMQGNEPEEAFAQFIK